MSTFKTWLSGSTGHGNARFGYREYSFHDMHLIQLAQPKVKGRKHHTYVYLRKRMSKAPILIVDDDEEDLELIQEAIVHLTIDRPFHYFRDGNGLVKFLKSNTESPFLIICDLNLPGETGFHIKKRISDDQKLKYKSVPFIFWSTDASEKQIQEAYDLPAQGFFFKPGKFDELCATIETIMSYWTKSKHPKSVI